MYNYYINTDKTIIITESITVWNWWDIKRKLHQKDAHTPMGFNGAVSVPI